MAIEIPRFLVEFILLGPEDDRRQLQDSPILGDVWIEFAKNPGQPLELLITPYKDHAAGTVASELSSHDEIQGADVAYLQGIVAARLTFEEVLRFVVPMTRWWNETRLATAIRNYAKNPKAMERDINAILEELRKWRKDRTGAAMQDVETHKRYIALAGLILWARLQRPSSKRARLSSEEQIDRILARNIARVVADGLKEAFARLPEPTEKDLVWTVSMNRQASHALAR